MGHRYEGEEDRHKFLEDGLLTSSVSYSRAVLLRHVLGSRNVHHYPADLKPSPGFETVAYRIPEGKRFFSVWEQVADVGTAIEFPDIPNTVNPSRRLRNRYNRAKARELSEQRNAQTRGLAGTIRQSGRRG